MDVMKGSRSNEYDERLKKQFSDHSAFRNIILDAHYRLMYRVCFGTCVSRFVVPDSKDSV